MTTIPDASPPMNHVFVDFENMHHMDAAVIGTKAVNFTILLGAKQTKLDAALVEKLLEHAASVHLVRLSSSNKNAVDFALTYYLGRAVLADPTAYFHIISKDTGYDPLIEHLRSRHVRVRRHVDYTALTFAAPPKVVPGVAKPPAAKPKAAPAAPKMTPEGPEDQLALVVARLRKHTTNRPKKKRTLLRHLKSNLGKEATDADAIEVLEKLSKTGYVKVDDNEDVTYQV
jgi:hypothetical protein